MMHIETNPLTCGFGLEVIGVDAQRPIDAATRRTILAAWIRGGILLFRDIASSEAHVALSQCFGTLEPSATKDLNLSSNPFLMELKFDPANPAGPGTRLLVNGQERAGWLGWHWDQAFMPVIVRGAALRMIEPAESAGETGFIDAISAYERLPKALRERIEGLQVVYAFTSQMEKNRFGFPKDLVNLRPLNEPGRYQFDPVVHPLVITQKETGRKVLKLSPMHAQYVLGMDRAESDALLTQLADRLVDPRHAYFHDWRKNDLIVWDNWRVIHSANGVPLSCRRLAHRTTIIGDYGYGRYLDAARDRTDIGATLVD
jgi:taurine dioxygenase